jgi:hypothetical protein
MNQNSRTRAAEHDEALSRIIEPQLFTISGNGTRPENRIGVRIGRDDASSSIARDAWSL